MLCYVAWISRSGSINAGSMQPYLSAMNMLFSDHLVYLAALGPILSAARRGLGMQHEPIEKPERLVPVLAPIVRELAE